MMFVESTSLFMSKCAPSISLANGAVGRRRRFSTTGALTGAASTLARRATVKTERRVLMRTMVIFSVVVLRDCVERRRLEQRQGERRGGRVTRVVSELSRRGLVKENGTEEQKKGWGRTGYYILGEAHSEKRSNEIDVCASTSADAKGHQTCRVNGACYHLHKQTNKTTPKLNINTNNDRKLMQKYIIAPNRECHRPALGPMSMRKTKQGPGGRERADELGKTVQTKPLLKFRARLTNVPLGILPFHNSS